MLQQATASSQTRIVCVILALDVGCWTFEPFERSTFFFVTEGWLSPV